jgi:uncharacterized protein (TIGR02001 family)
MRIKHTCVGSAVAALLVVPHVGFAGELTANAGVTNNYIWRGLTQTQNEAAVSGGIDFVADSGFYIGTWASNVQYAPADDFSYEHDIYFGFSGGDKVTYDIGYLYYNYDDINNFDFGEIYASIGVGGFSAKLSVLANTEADEPPGMDFGFGEASYLSLDYTFSLRDDLSLTLHAGRHQGDFAEVFNGVPGSYNDYGITLSKGGFSFGITDTDLDSEVSDSLDNGSIKFVVGFTMDFDL